ncbi:MAG: pyridoxamine 5'-phosphate oxidase family protein [Pseudomonadota bacterium]
MAAWQESLEGTRSQVWSRWSRGVADRRCATRHPTLCTVGLDGAPQARTVVLRACDPAEGMLEMHADLASAKIAELAAEPRAALHVWDARLKLQMRLAATVEVLSGEAVATRWARVPEGPRRAYGGTPPPGAALEDPRAHDAEPTAERFAALLARVEAIETLHLGPDLHRRARFLRAEDWRGVWLAP